MLRLPKFEIATPRSVNEAVTLLAEAGPSALIVAGGTDLLPNMKHELFTPDLVVSLAKIPELVGVRRIESGWLAIGAMTSLADVAANELVREQAPALAQAAGIVAGPQLRTMGTLGGNVMLDTRCQWYNQTYFWRQALGFCLKKDGALCHVVAGGSKCVAAASNDTAPALMTLSAVLEIEGPDGRRSVPIDDFYVSDGIHNKKLDTGEILVEIRVPPTAPGHRGAYGKLRDRGSIDFPLLGVAVRLDLDAAAGAQGVSGSTSAPRSAGSRAADHLGARTHGAPVIAADVVLTALQARPVRIKRAREILLGTRPGTTEFETAVSQVAEQAYKQCHPMPNIPGDADYRREMVPVYVRRTLIAASLGGGPVQAD